MFFKADAGVFLRMLSIFNELHQLFGILGQRMACRGRLFDHRCVGLRDLVELVDRGVDLRNARRLFLRGR